MPSKKVAKKAPAAKKVSRKKEPHARTLFISEAAVDIVSKCGPVGLQKAKDLKFLIETEFGTHRALGVSCRLNRSAAPSGTFRVIVADETVVDLPSMVRPYRKIVDLSMETLVGDVFDSIDACLVD